MTCRDLFNRLSLEKIYSKAIHNTCEMEQNVKPGPHTVKLIVLKASSLLQFFCFEFTL